MPKFKYTGHYIHSYPDIKVPRADGTLKTLVAAPGKVYDLVSPPRIGKALDPRWLLVDDAHPVEAVQVDEKVHLTGDQLAAKGLDAPPVTEAPEATGLASGVVEDVKEVISEAEAKVEEVVHDLEAVIEDAVETKEQ